MILLDSKNKEGYSLTYPPLPL